MPAARASSFPSRPSPRGRLALELLAALRKIEARGALEVASRVNQRFGAIFRYAVATGRCERNPVADLRGALKAPKREHRAALSAADLPDYLQQLETYDGQLQTKLALKLLALTFVRTGELRGAKWSEFDLDIGEWRIPAERMKAAQGHRVPLSDAALAIIDQMASLRRMGDYVFPGIAAGRPISASAIRLVIGRIGNGGATTHGMRACFRSWCADHGITRDLAEQCLAHAIGNAVEQAYNRTDLLGRRRPIMDAWAAFCAEREDNSVVQLRG
jgi:integrase